MPFDVDGKTVRLYDDAYRGAGGRGWRTYARGLMKSTPAYRGRGVKIAEILHTYFMNGPLAA